MCKISLSFLTKIYVFCYVFIRFPALGKNAPRYDRIKNLRSTVHEQDKEAVYLFYNNILPCLSGKKYWKHKFRKEMVSQAITVHLEALALWILHNYERKWLGNDNEKEENALYTGLNKGNKMYSGWDNEGIQKFNELCKFVQQNRIEVPEYELELMERMNKEYEDDESRKKQDKTTVAIECFDGLDGKLQDLPRNMHSYEPPQTTVVCNMQQGHSEVASTISNSSASTSYRSAEYYNTGSNNNDSIYSVAI